MSKVLFAVLLAVLSPVYGDFGPYRVEYVKNFDGDTATFNFFLWPGLTMREQVRFYGIDTPEIRGKCEQEKALAIEARDFVRARLERGNLRVTVVGEGKFGRSLVIIEDVIGELLRVGLAKPWNGRGSKPKWCEE